MPVDRWVAVGLASLTLFAVACLDTPGPPLPSATDDEQAARLIDVTDGDSLTIEVQGAPIRIRLAGINAPESDECLGAESTDSLRRLLDGDTVDFEPIDTDQYGRTVAYVSNGSEVVNLVQVRGGMAVAFTDRGSLTDEILTAESEARVARVGWWDPASCGDVEHAGVSVRIVEADPPGPDDDVLDQELVVITAEAETDLSGWTLRDESTINRLTFPDGTVVSPDRPLEISSGCDGLGWCTGRSIWNNGGDAAILQAPGGSIVAIDRYRP